MNKLEYFLKAIKESRHLSRAWGQIMFAETRPNKEYPKLGLRVSPKGALEVMVGDDYVVVEALPSVGYYGIDESVKLKTGDMKCVKKDITTTYGALLMNSIVIEYPYMGEVEYVNEYMKDSTLNDIALIRLKETRDVPAHLRFENATNFLTSLSQIAVPSATRKSMVPQSNIIALRDRLLKEHKDEMGDPAVVANIQNQLMNLDKENLKDDPAMGFLIKKKNFAVTRLAMMGMVGSSPDFFDETKLTVQTTSLQEGWTIKDIPARVNNSRMGSFARGQETALGGAEVKSTSRVFQNYKIGEHDCGVKIGVPLFVAKDVYKSYVGRYIVGNKTPLNLGTLERNIGKTIIMRTPGYCKSKGASVCEICMGDLVTDAKLGLNTQTNTVTSAYMSLFMAKMHATTLEVYEYDYMSRIT